MRLLDDVRRFAARLTAGLRRAAHAVRAWATGLTASVRRAANRHRDRVTDDPAYTRTVANAVSELAVTLLPKPNVATAAAILLTGIFSPDPTPTHHPVSRQTTVFDEGQYEPYPVTRRPASPSTSPWDRYNT
jgi:hypothetical protein